MLLKKNPVLVLRLAMLAYIFASVASLMTRKSTTLHGDLVDALMGFAYGLSFGLMLLYVYMQCRASHQR